MHEAGRRLDRGLPSFRTGAAKHEHRHITLMGDSGCMHCVVLMASYWA
jgi:hypothetical protein